MEEKRTTFKNFRDLIKNTVYTIKILWGKFPVLLSLMILLSIITGAVPIIFSKYLGILIDKVTLAIENNSIQIILPTLVVFSILSILPKLIEAILTYVDESFFARTIDYFEIEMLKKRMSFDVAQIENPKFLDKAHKAFSLGIGPIINLIDYQINNLEIITGIVLGSLVTILIDWKVFLIVFATSIPNFIVEIKHSKTFWSIWAHNTPESRRAGYLETFFKVKTEIIDAKLNNLGNRFLGMIEKILGNYTEKRIKNIKNKTRIKMVTELLSGIGFFVGMLMIVNKSISGAIAIGTIVFLYQSLSSMSQWTSNTVSRSAILLERNLFVTDIYEILKGKPILPRQENPIKLNLSKPPTIIFQNVFFKYQGQTRWALNNVSFRIDPGQKIGLVGDNGSGKTTLIKLLLRIYDPVKGKITVNGIDLKNINIDEWWSYMGILLQDYPDYNFTVKESIAISEESDTIDEDKVIKSAEQSTSDAFINQLDKKYDNMIGVEFDGIEPSKGQRQKLAIARAFYKTKRMLILDEPTASIDADSQSKIFRKIENLPKDISAILISHNFATIKKADKIIVLDYGFKIEEGSHDELITLKSKYFRGYEQQRREFN